MAKRSVRRGAALLALGAMLLAVTTGCNFVKAGAKCKPGSPAGRDANFVLFCVNGKWKRVVTIDQAAQIIVSSWPTDIVTIDGGGQTTGIGEAFAPVSVKVTRKDGLPVKGAEVVFTGPDSGASLAAPGRATTDVNGVAQVTLVANSVLGGYGVAATVQGATHPYTVFGLNNAAASAATIQVVSGGGQSAVAGTQFASPVVVKAVDRFGNTVQYKNFEFSSTAPGVWFGPAQAFAAEDGLATTTIGTGNVSGPVPITVKVVGTTTAITFNLTVVAGPIDHALDFFSGDGQTANLPGDQFPNRVNNPLIVGILDLFGNGVANQAVTWVIHPNGGASGTFDVNGQTTATINTDNDGTSRARLTGNGTSGSFTVDATVDGLTHTFTVTNP